MAYTTEGHAGEQVVGEGYTVGHLKIELGWISDPTKANPYEI
jgi:hypothetical protein